MSKPVNKKTPKNEQDQVKFAPVHMVRSKRAEKRLNLDHLKSRGNSGRRRKKDFNAGPVLVMGLVVVLCAAIIFIMWSLLFHKNAQVVRIDDAQVAYIKDVKTTSEEFNKLILAKLKEKTGNNVQLNEVVSLVPVKVNPKKVNTNTESVVAEICDKLTYKQEAAAVMIKGEQKAVLANKEEAEQLLNQLLDMFKPEGEPNVVEVAYSDDVQIESVFVDEDEVMSTVKASDILRAYNKEPKTYVVQQGDSFSGIAAKADMTEEELLAANPSFTRETMHKIKIGQQLNITMPVPVLSVKIVKEEKTTADIDVPVETIENANEPKSYNKIIAEGKKGTKEVTSYVTYVNGSETGREVVSEKTVTEPQPRRVEVGTKTG